MRTLRQDMPDFRFLGPVRAKESKRRQKTHVPATIHLWVPGSGFQLPGPGSSFQVPDPRSRVFDYQPYIEVKSNGSTRKQAPTTLLLLFPATNPDIPLKEAKDMRFYKFSRPHASPSF
ncbi:hypothetical protein Bca52824_001194 [Brassica carinata]|uniref:Uncharacterized protein n=1 Tax=Brassica carinata TaxID=52824 RepID=A0A8X7WFU1_BRACI|nr:hypothetical protein Bca52824_001194 [Brassica carinata]